MPKAPTLAELAEITPGYSIPGAVRHDPSGNYQLILPRHLDVGGRPFVFDSERDSQRMTLPDRADRYRVRAGDVLFVSRGDRNRAVSIKACPEDSVATSSLYVIRPRADLDSDYLAWALNQEASQVAIGQARTGAGTPMVQRAALAELRIAVTDPRQQRRIVALAALLQHEQDLVDRLGQTLQRRNRVLGNRLLKTTSTQES